jgi:hypothetical protein
MVLKFLKSNHGIENYEVFFGSNGSLILIFFSNTQSRWLFDSGIFQIPKTWCLFQNSKDKNHRFQFFPTLEFFLNIYFKLARTDEDITSSFF